MKKIFFLLMLTALVLSCLQAQPSQQTSQQPAWTAAAEITFTFTRQSGSASNQYAVWIENAQGQHVKTLYATRWTANGGYRTRPASIPVWVRLSGLANMSREQVDAVSSATPRTGNVTYTWDGTDSRGEPAADGGYVMVLEGTLRWENQVIYRAPFRLGAASGQIQVSVQYSGDSTAERGMIGDVKVRALR